MAKAPPSVEGFGSLLASHHRKSPGGRCTVLSILAAMAPADADALRAALADRDTYSSTALARALNEYGFKISHSSVQRHRSKGCQCE